MEVLVVTGHALSNIHKVVQYVMKNENWKAIAGYEGLYEVSDLGRVKSLGNNKTRKEKILKQHKIGSGYLNVCLYKDGQIKNWKVHRLVAESFIPNPNNLETVNHKDEVKTNNTVCNLEWMSLKDNLNYGTHNKRVGESLSKQVQMFDKFTGELLATFPSTMEAGIVTGINNGNISSCCNGNRKSAGGYVWKYTPEW